LRGGRRRRERGEREAECRRAGDSMVAHPDSSWS
jgi:hypothetical protein